MAGAFDSATELTVDATSPISDAIADRVLYDPSRNADRVAVAQIANRIVNGQGWDCPCPFCSHYEKRHPRSEKRAVDWWAHAGRPAILMKDLQPSQPLAKALPILAARSGSAARELSDTYIAHNHWVLYQIMRQIPNGRERAAWARATIEQMLGYESATTNRGLRAALDVLHRSEGAY